jgi:hypothetical protein
MTDNRHDTSDTVVCSGVDCPEEDRFSQSTSRNTENEKKIKKLDGLVLSG